jgi:hypothetical protein
MKQRHNKRTIKGDTDTRRKKPPSAPNVAELEFARKNKAMLQQLGDCYHEKTNKS